MNKEVIIEDKFLKRAALHEPPFSIY